MLTHKIPFNGEGISICVSTTVAYKGAENGKLTVVNSRDRVKESGRPNSFRNASVCIISFGTQVPGDGQRDYWEKDRKFSYAKGLQI